MGVFIPWPSLSPYGKNRTFSLRWMLRTWKMRKSSPTRRQMPCWRLRRRSLGMMPRWNVSKLPSHLPRPWGCFLLPTFFCFLRCDVSVATCKYDIHGVKIEAQMHTYIYTYLFIRMYIYTHKCIMAICSAWHISNSETPKLSLRSRCLDWACNPCWFNRSSRWEMVLFLGGMKSF